MSSNEVSSDPIIDPISSGFGMSGAVLCSILGTLVNGLTLMVILFQPAVKYHSTSPLLFFQAVGDLIFSSLYLPMVAVRFYHQDKLMDHLPKDGCAIFGLLFYACLGVSTYILSLISVNRLFVCWDLADQYFSWK